MQASPEVSTRIRDVFLNVGATLTCEKCKEHYRTYEPAFGDMEASDPKLALQWLQTLRGAIQKRVEQEIPDAKNTTANNPQSQPPESTKKPFRSCLPTPAAHVFGPWKTINNHTPAALASQNRAMEAALSADPLSACQLDPLVPSSKQPHPCEWMPHVWYMLRGAALQARPDLPLEQQQNLILFFRNLDAVLPSSKTYRKLYKGFFAASPFSVEEATCAEKAIAWLEHVRIDMGFPLAFPPTNACRDLPGIPRTPISVYGPCNLVFSETAKTRACLQAAIEGALKSTHLNRGKEDCGCSAKPPKYAPPMF
jgi:hypothetical protein